MKKILCILLSLLLVLLNGCSSDTGNIRFGAAGVGGMYYTFANSFTGILSKENENYSYEVKNTAGSTANIRLLSNHYIDLAIAQADLIQDAYEGTGAFDGNICKDYSAIAGLYTEACQIVVRADSSIYSLDDLQGKHISIGASESGTERNAKEILAATGLTSRLVQTEIMIIHRPPTSFPIMKLMPFFVLQVPRQRLSRNWQRSVQSGFSA